MTERRTTVPAVRGAKRRDGAAPLTMVTAYDEPGARLVDAGGVDMILVGDSVGNNVLGLENSMAVTMEMMLHHTRAVAAARPDALIIGDLPWMSYHVTTQEAVRNAASLIRAGAQAVKLEGGSNRTQVISAIIDAEIPVMGHLGLTPQSVAVFGGFRVQGKSVEAADEVRRAAEAIEAAGVFAMVLEGIPGALGAVITNERAVPTIGIGAGASTDGQVLVFHDLLGLGSAAPPKFVRQYGHLGSEITKAVHSYVEDVRGGSFPSDDETYVTSDELRSHLED